MPTLAVKDSKTLLKTIEIIQFGVKKTKSKLIVYYSWPASIVHEN